jgi:AraC family transcriptional regulator, transcriptional activator of the genes for pyochelin and ferripyochelin receptors
MDKIVTYDWMKSFGSINQQLVYASDRYFEVVTEVAEPHLASATSRTIGMPGLTLDNVVIRPGKSLSLVDLTEKKNIMSSFVISGQADSTFDFGSRRANIENNKHGFQYSPGYKAEHRIVAEQFQALSLDITPEFFESLMAGADGNMEGIFNHFAGGGARREVLMLRPRMQEIINYIIQCPFKGVTRYLFIESKVLELLALQIDQLNAKESPRSAPSRVDMEKLCAVREFIENNYLEPLSIAGLCKTFSLNEFKLKKGYKEMFSITVFGHINSLRMEKARLLLSQRTMTISEISDFIGYNHIGSFSAEYKKRYGYAPSKH